jgi:hypothetical protein
VAKLQLQNSCIERLPVLFNPCQGRLFCAGECRSRAMTAAPRSLSDVGSRVTTARLQQRRRAYRGTIVQFGKFAGILMRASSGQDDFA